MYSFKNFCRHQLRGIHILQDHIPLQNGKQATHKTWMTNLLWPVPWEILWLGEFQPYLRMSFSAFFAVGVWGRACADFQFFLKLWSTVDDLADDVLQFVQNLRVHENLQQRSKLNFWKPYLFNRLTILQLIGVFYSSI